MKRSLFIIVCLLSFTVLLSACTKKPEENAVITPEEDISSSITAEPFVTPTAIEDNDEGTYDLDRTGDDLSSYEALGQGEIITREELAGPLESSEFRTYFTRFDGTDIVFDSMYRFSGVSHENDVRDTSFNGRSVSFLLGQGNVVPFETMNISSGSDYAYVIQTIAKRQYREATEDDWNSSVGNTAFLVCYVDNPDGTTDCFWCDANLYVLHMTGKDLPDVHFPDISIEPLTEEEYAHLHVIAASYLYAATDLAMYPFKYTNIMSADTVPSDEIGVMVIKDGLEVILEDEDVDRLIEMIKETDMNPAEERSLYSCASIADYEQDGTIHFLAVRKKEHSWEDGVFWDDLYLTGDGKMIRKREVIRSTIIGGNEGMNIQGLFITASMYSYPINEFVNNIISKQQ